MQGLKTLIAMQLKDKIDFSFTKSVKQTIFKVVFAILKFAIITGLIYVAFNVISLLRLTSLNAGIPTNFFSIVFGVMVVLSVIVSTFGLTKSLYLAKDNQVLLTMPTNRLTVFISKLIVYIVYEFIRNLTYIVPILCAYGIINKMPVYFYLWVLFANVLITLLTTSIGALLSIPMLLLTFILKRNKLLEYLIVLTAIVFVVYVTVRIIAAIPADIDLISNWGTIFWDIQDFLNNFTKTFAPLFYLTIAFVGYKYGLVNQFFIPTQFWCLLAIILLVVSIYAITFVIVRPIFFKMASKPFEYSKKINTKFKLNIVKGPFLGGLKKEVMLTYRSGEKFNSLLMITIVMPIAIFLLNKIFVAMDTRLVGTYLTMMFNVLLISLISLASNGVVSKIYSEEGGASYINKTVPTTYAKVLFTKLLIYIITINLSILASVIIFASFYSFTVFETIIIFLTFSFVYTGHLFWSASLDIMNPQTEQYKTTGTHTNNPNEIKSTISAFLMSALVALLFFFFVNENIASVWYKILLVTTIYFAWNIYMYFNKIKVYYKEK